MTRNNSRLPVYGVVPVLETPFLDDGSIDIEGFSRVIDRVVASGVTGAMFPGFASEFRYLADQERDDLVNLLLERTADLHDFTRIVSIPDQATVLAVERAREAVARGADAINLLPPHQPAPGAAALRAHIVAVARAVDPVPVVLQYAPAQTGTSLDAAGIASIVTEVPNIVEVKVESTPPGALIAALAAQHPAIPSAVGYAGVQLIDALRRGAVGVMPGCTFVEIYQQIWQLWTAGDTRAATALHGRLLPYISYWMQSVDLIIAAEKRIGMRRGWTATDHCRAPARLLDEDESAMIERFLVEFAELLP